MATDLPDDTQLKRRARRRLIGAIALVLLAVIVLPMIFDAEQKPLDQDVSIEIPAQKDYIAKAPPAAASMPLPKEAGKDAGTPAPTPPKAEATPPPEAPKAEAAPPKAEKAETPKAETAEAPKAEVPKAEKAPPKVEKDAKAKPPGKLDAEMAREKADAARAQALLNGEAIAPKSEKAAEKTEVASAGGYALQIGAFSTEEKVQDVRDKLSGAGLKTYVEKVSTQSGTVTRVRAGPFGSKDAAEAARSKIAGLGFASATVVRR